VKIEKIIKVNHEIDVVLQIMSDPTFLIPRLFPSISEIKVNGGEFYYKGKVAFISYEGKGRVFVGAEGVRIVYETSRGSGIVLLQKFNDNSVKITIQHDNELYGNMGKLAINSNLSKLEKNINEDIRLERIKRKI